MTTTQVIALGSSIGIMLPSEVVDWLKIVSGDQLRIVETPNGIELQRIDPSFADETEAFDRVMQEDDAALRRLAE